MRVAVLLEDRCAPNMPAFAYLQKYAGIKIKTYEKFGHAIIDMANNGNDGVVGDSVQVNYYFNKNNCFK